MKINFNLILSLDDNIEFEPTQEGIELYKKYWYLKDKGIFRYGLHKICTMPLKDFLILFGKEDIDSLIKNNQIYLKTKD